MAIKKRLSVLHVCGGPLDRGGITAFLLQHMIALSGKGIVFDYLCMGVTEPSFVKKVNLFGGRVFQIPYGKVSFIGNVLGLIKGLASKHYDVIHVHLDAKGFVIGWILFFLRVKSPVIYHSHNTGHATRQNFFTILHDLYKLLTRRVATHKLACSASAGNWLFGNNEKDCAKVTDFVIIPNSISYDKFLFCDSQRQLMRSSLECEYKNVIGMVGRLEDQKNHRFIIDVAKCFLEDKDTVFLIVGDGPLMKPLKGLCQEEGVDNIIWYGESLNVHSIINCFDLFVMPSLFEGLGIACVEAQYNGLHCVVSDFIPKEVDFTGNVTFLPLVVKEWVSEIKMVINSGRSLLSKESCESFDINRTASVLEGYYLGVVSK